MIIRSELDPSEKITGTHPLALEKVRRIKEKKKGLLWVRSGRCSAAETLSCLKLEAAGLEFLPVKMR